MVYDCGSCLAKYVLCVFNFFIFLAGSVVLSLGIWLAVDKNSFIGISKIVPDDQVQEFARPAVVEQAAYFLLAVGAVTFLLSFLGYCGALKESSCMLTTYGVLLLLILILEIVVGCLAVVYKSKAESETRRALRWSLDHAYAGGTADGASGNGDALSLAWDRLQEGLRCCGVEGGADYAPGMIPAACCAAKGTGCPAAPTATNSFYDKGCYNEVINWLMLHLNIIIISAITLGIIEVLGIVFACCLAKSINDYRK